MIGPNYLMLNPVKIRYDDRESNSIIDMKWFESVCNDKFDYVLYWVPNDKQWYVNKWTSDYKKYTL